MSDRHADLAEEFERQVDNLVTKGYPEQVGLAATAFRRRLAPLRDQLPASSAEAAPGRIPFVIVTSTAAVPAERAISLVDLAGKPGLTTMDGDDLRRFTTVDAVEMPAGAAYLLLDVDAGRGTRNVTPDDVGKIIEAGGRSPLTIAEGIAVVTHHPAVLRTETCFSMLASRSGDRRVTAIWISAGRPRLGWCWAGNPHTWLGSASCGGRAGADVALPSDTASDAAAAH